MSHKSLRIDSEDCLQYCRTQHRRVQEAHSMVDGQTRRHAKHDTNDNTNNSKNRKNVHSNNDNNNRKNMWFQYNCDFDQEGPKKFTKVNMDDTERLVRDFQFRWNRHLKPIR